MGPSAGGTGFLFILGHPSRSVLAPHQAQMTAPHQPGGSRHSLAIRGRVPCLLVFFLPVPPGQLGGTRPLHLLPHAELSQPNRCPPKGHVMLECLLGDSTVALRGRVTCLRSRVLRGAAQGQNPGLSSVAADSQRAGYRSAVCKEHAARFSANLTT